MSADSGADSVIAKHKDNIIEATIASTNQPILMKNKQLQTSSQYYKELWYCKRRLHMEKNLGNLLKFVW